MAAPVVHWEIHALDGKRLQDFYSNLFGWKVDANNPMNYGLVDTGSTKGAMGGIAQRGEQSPPANITFYVEVEDLQDYLSKAEMLGGRTVVPVTEIPDAVTMAMFSDPDGNVIGLIKPMPAPPKPAATKKAKSSRTRSRPVPRKRTAAKKRAKSRR